MTPRVEIRYQVPGVGHPDRPRFDVLAEALAPHLQAVLDDTGIAATLNINTRVVHTERFGVPASINIEVLVRDAASLQRAEQIVLESLDALDAAEGVDRSPPLYRRREVETGGERAWIYVYARPLEGTLKIESGDWTRRY